MCIHTHTYIYREREGGNEREVLWNGKKIWNTEVSALIGTATS